MKHIKNRQAGFAHVVLLVIVMVGVASFGVFTLVRSQAARNPRNSRDSRNEVNIGTAQSAEALAFTQIESRSSGTTLPREFLEITDQNVWKELWARYHADNTKVPSLPQVDFSKERVIVVSRGEQSSGGNDVKIPFIALATETKGSRSRSSIEVSVVEQNTADGCLSTSQLQSPYQIVKMSNQPRNKVTFKFRTESIPC